MAHEPKITQFDGTKQIEHTLIEYSELSDLRDKDKFGRRAWEMLKEHCKVFAGEETCYYIDTSATMTCCDDCTLKALLDEGQRLYGGGK